MEQIGTISQYLFPELYTETMTICDSTSNKKEWTEHIESLLLQMTSQEIDDVTRRYTVHGLILAYVYLQQNDIKALQDWTERGGLI